MVNKPQPALPPATPSYNQLMAQRPMNPNAVSPQVAATLQGRVTPRDQLTPDQMAYARSVTNAPPRVVTGNERTLLPMAPGVTPQAGPPQAGMMDPRTIFMNPESGLSMFRRPSGPMSLMEQIMSMNPQQQQSMIASALMPPPQQQAPAARAPMQQMPMMGNLFGLGRGMR